MRFFKSFKYAFRGIIYCINNERNMRIHTVAALYVFVFSFFFEMSRTSYAAVLIAIAMVITAELFNTVAEELCDMAAASFHPVVRIIKDMAAGAVLISAVFAAAVGVCVFWQPASFAGILRYFASSPLMLLPLAAVTAVCIVYIVMGPIGIRDYIRKKREK
ncbi:diacylglycerol kinase family protein [Caproiciproducens faecalis]|uniref:Diacylglycerol kinase family protein n=1 Tax=Caproiciproducens faecalis TaxID=2820301 RepID=A0ABS7DKP2_9FIRM|nr:diacylglycerol kinase family protein [Caproiciproducens faecalis]MBW7571652.1 diacylglycerol kinase family protein [Caproiciproducens faecalis]